MRTGSRAHSRRLRWEAWWRPSPRGSRAEHAVAGPAARGPGSRRRPSCLEPGPAGLLLTHVSLPSTGMNALQLQNLATLAAAAAAAQTSATTTNANPLSTTSSALGALTSPGKGVPPPGTAGRIAPRVGCRCQGQGGAPWAWGVGLDPCEVS